MNAQPTLKPLAAVAGALNHGWARFAHAAGDAKTLDEAFARITAAMEAWEAERRAEWTGTAPWGAADAGLRPWKEHTSTTGRYVVKLGKRCGEVIVTIHRPAGPIAEVVYAGGNLEAVSFTASKFEARHVAELVELLFATVGDKVAHKMAGKLCAELPGEVLEEVTRFEGVFFRRVAAVAARAMEDLHASLPLSRERTA